MGVGFSAIDIDAYQLSAPFWAVCGWRLADLIDRLEPAWLVGRAGMLIISCAQK